MSELAFVVEDADVLDGRVGAADGKDLGFVGCYGDGAAVWSHGDEHVGELEGTELAVHFVELVDFVLLTNPVVIVVHGKLRLR